MIGRLKHLAIAVPDLDSAVRVYRGMLGAEVSEPAESTQDAARVVTVTLPNTVLRLMEPLDDTSPLCPFVEQHPFGGVHHICYEVADVEAAAHGLSARGARLAGRGEPETDERGKRTVFLHQNDFLGTLIKLEEA